MEAQQLINHARLSRTQGTEGNVKSDYKRWIDEASITSLDILSGQSNAGPHVAILTREKICALRWKTLPHRPYSPHIPPSGYRSFSLFFQNFNFISIIYKKQFNHQNIFPHSSVSTRMSTNLKMISPLNTPRVGQLPSLSSEWSAETKSNMRPSNFFGVSVRLCRRCCWLSGVYP
uniref:Uncharacterized protein n=1 Tax=Heterorhabditis bacteriophora TaxID=37862 RepID=A0A1I7WUR1_HETBA